MNLKTLTAPLGTWKFWKELLIMTVGMFIAAAAVYYFLVPSKIVVGSISGLSIVISALFEQAGMAVKVSTVVLIINAILLVLAWFLIGKEFGVKTCYTALILGPMMDLWEKICPYERLLEPGATSVMGDLWFDLICFVLILSMSQAIMFRINASTGGLDILAKMEADEADDLMILAGEDMDDERFDALVERIQEQFEDLEIDAQRGEQPLYPIVLSVE